jgi:hypothetical protein
MEVFGLSSKNLIPQLEWHLTLRGIKVTPPVGSIKTILSLVVILLLHTMRQSQNFKKAVEEFMTFPALSLLQRY